MSLLRPRLVLFFLAFLVGTSCEAQALGRNTPGEFDYYVLVLGWAPSYCLTEGRLRRDAECNSAKPHAFVLHGLWPQYEKGWPEDCSIGKRPWVPTSVIDEMRDIMPTMNTGRTAPAPDSTRCNISAWCASFMSA